MSHIRHLDIKLTLMASVLSNLMLMIIDVLFYSMIFGGGDLVGVEAPDTVCLGGVGRVRFDQDRNLLRRPLCEGGRHRGRGLKEMSPVQHR